MGEVLVCVGSGVGLCLGVVDAERILGVEVAVVAIALVGVDCVGGASRIVLSKPYIEIQITIREAPLINLCFSIRSGLHSMPSVGATVRRSVNLSVGAIYLNDSRTKSARTAVVIEVRRRFGVLRI